MRLIVILIAIAVSLFAVACGGDSEPASPLKTLQTYQKALKAKDTTTMKMLLTADSIKMLEQEAKSQGLTVDDVVKRDTFFSESQRTVEFRNQKIDGPNATIEIKISPEKWDTVPFLFEGDQWKIDKKAYGEQLMQEIMRRQQDAFGADASMMQPDFPSPQTSPF